MNENSPSGSPLRMLLGILTLVVAFVLLNMSLTFENVWPTAKIRWSNAISIELTVCVLLLVLAHHWARSLSRHVFPALWLLFVVGHYIDVTSRGLYGRDFNVYWDSQHLGNVAAMLSRSTPGWLIALTISVVVVVLALMFVIARLAFTRVAATVKSARMRAGLGVMSAVLVLIFAVQQLSAQPSAVLPFARPVTPAFVRQARYVAAMLGPGAVAPVLGASPNLHHRLDRLAGADVLLVFLESYGAVTYETPQIADGLVSGQADLRAAVEDTDREVVTAYVESPTFGGSSWLAHLTLISGIDVRDPYAYTSLMASQRDTMISNFARRGYRTVALMPGMRQAWPEGAFYRYDDIYGRDRLEYKGPEFGWWSIPDQYALAKIDALERQRLNRKPLFIVFPTSTTHAPFGPVAPYQHDWSRMLTEDAFAEHEVERAMAIVPDLTNLRPSYIRAMAYEYATIAGYLRQHPRDDMVMIAIGDHQPPAAVSGVDASWSVPVHVIGRRGPILDRLVDRGFRRGLDPRRPTIGQMHALTAVLLEAFTSP